MWRQFLNNPEGRNVGDCSVRAISKALDVDWDTAYLLITAEGFCAKDMPSSDSIWGNVLRQNGFYRSVIPNSCPECYTAEDFCRDHPKGIYVLGFGGHVATVVDGILYDSWNSSQEIPVYVWVKKGTSHGIQFSSRLSALLSKYLRLIHAAAEYDTAASAE